MSKVNAAAFQTVDASCLGDVRDDGDEEGDNGILENSEPILSVPLQAVDLLSAASAALGDFEGGEEDVAVLCAGRNEFAEQEEEAAQGDRLEEVEPGVEVDVAVGGGDGDPRYDRVDWDEGGDLQYSSHVVSNWPCGIEPARTLTWFARLVC